MAQAKIRKPPLSFERLQVPPAFCFLSQEQRFFFSWISNGPWNVTSKPRRVFKSARASAGNLCKKTGTPSACEARKKKQRPLLRLGVTGQRKTTSFKGWRDAPGSGKVRVPRGRPRATTPRTVFHGTLLLARSLGRSLGTQMYLSLQGLLQGTFFRCLDSERSLRYERAKGTPSYMSRSAWRPQIPKSNPSGLPGLGVRRGPHGENGSHWTPFFPDA